MKKAATLILIIFAITLATAQPILELNKQIFQPGETLLGKITTTGEFAEKINLNQIKIFQGKKQVPFIFDITFYNNTNFLYAYLNREGNFTIKINNILYRENQELREENIEQEIEVKQQFIDGNKTQTAVLSIKPGFIFTTDYSQINLENKGNTDLEISYLEETITIAPQETKEIIHIPGQTVSYLDILTYELFKIPIIYIPIKTSPINITNKLDTPLKAKPIYVHANVVPYQEIQEIIELINFADTNITITSIENSLEIISFQAPETIQAKSIYNLSLTFNAIEQGFFEDNLIINFLIEDQTQTITIPVSIYSFPEETDLENIQESDKTCSELAGTVCTSNQLCTISSTLTFGGEYCCLGTCETKKIDKPGSWGWLWGIIIVLVLGTAGYFIYKKFKKTKPIQPKDAMKKSSELYEKRVKGSLAKT